MHPEFEILSADDEEGEAGLHTGRIVPIYEAAGKITTRVFRSLLRRILDNLPPLDDPLPEHIRAAAEAAGPRRPPCTRSTSRPRTKTSGC